MSDKERIVAVAIGVLGAVVFPLFMIADRRSSPGPLMFAAGLALGLALVAWFFRSRIVVMLACIGPMLALTFNTRSVTTKAGKVVRAQPMAPLLFAYLFVGLMLWVMLRQSRDRRRLMAERLASGRPDGWADDQASRRAAASGSAPATVDAAGRPLASASRRYTPPKQKKAGRR